MKRHLLPALALLLLSSCSETPPQDQLAQKAENGDPAAQFELAERAFANGDNQTALKWLELSEQSGYAPARKTRALHEIRSAKPDDSPTEAIATLQGLAADGDVEASLALAKRYEQGIHGKSDPAKTYQYYQLAADLGDPYARYRMLLRSWLARKATMPSDEKKKLAEQSRQIGLNEDPRALSLLARILDADNQTGDADKYHLEAAKAGEPYSMYRIGVAYHRYIRDKTYGPLGFEYLEKAEKAGIAEALLPLAKAYYQGNGTALDKDKALSIATLAAWNGNPEAIEFVLAIYLAKPEWTIENKIEIRALQITAAKRLQKLNKRLNQRLATKGPLFDTFAKQRIVEVQNMLKTYKLSRRSGQPETLAPQSAIRPSDPFSKYGEDRETAIKGLFSADGEAALKIAKGCSDKNKPYYAPKESNRWIAHASSTGNAKAALTLYEIYRANPDDSGISKEQAANALRQAESNGDPNALMYSAHEYQNGDLFEKDSLLALRTAEKALDNGHEEARAFIKRHLLETADFEINSDHILAVVNEIADGGNVDFQFLRSAYQIGLHITRMQSAQHDRRQGSVHGVWFDARKDYKEIWRCYDLNLSSTENLPEPVTQAVDEILKLADAGYLRAIETAAMWSLHGKFAAPDPEKALHYFNACKEKSQEGGLFIEFANARMMGHGLPPDVVEAALIYRRAAELGNESAKSLFQDMGGSPPANATDNVYPYSIAETALKAKEQADPDAMFYLAIHLRNSTDLDETYTDSEYRRWLGEAAKNDSHEALLTISNNYFTGTDVEKNPQRAIRYLKRCADLGNADAQFGYGQILALGIEVETNIVEGMSYLERASKQGSQEATTLLKNLKATNVVQADKDTTGEDITVQFLSSVLGYDTFPIQPYAQNDRNLLPIVGANRTRPILQTEGKQTQGDKNLSPVLLAGDRFSDALITVKSALIMAPFLTIDDAVIFTGKDPSFTIEFVSDKSFENAFTLLMLKQGSGSATYHWRGIGKIKAGQRKKVQFQYDDPYVKGNDISLYFFSEYEEIPSNVRIQPQYFLKESLASFSEKRNEYLADKEGESLPPQITEPLKEQIGDVIYLPFDCFADFTLNEYGFVKTIQPPSEISEASLTQLYNFLPYLTFFPATHNGSPTEGQTRVQLD